MISTSSKQSEVDPSTLVAPDTPELNQAGSNPDHLANNNSEIAAALGIIVSAFVDLGFGDSAAHHALSAANRNHSWKTLANEFQRDAA